MSDRLADAIAALAEAIRAEVADATAPPVSEYLLSVDDVAIRLGIGRTAVYGEIANRRLRSVKVGRRRLVPASAVTAYIDALP